MRSCETVGKGFCITRMGTGRNGISYTIICLYTFNFKTFLVALLAMPVFLLCEVRPQYRYFLSNLATGYTRSTWHARRWSMFTSNKIGDIVSEWACSVAEQL